MDRIIGGAFLAEVGRSEVYNGFVAGHEEARVLQRRFDTVLAFFHGIVGQAAHEKFCDPDPRSLQS